MLTFIHWSLTLLSMLVVYLAWRLPGQPRWLPRAAALMVLLFAAADWIMLALMPLLGISYGKNYYSTFVLALFRILPFLLIPFALGRLLPPSAEKRPRFKPGIVLAGVCLLQAIISSATLHALYVEPHNLQLTYTAIAGPAYLPGQPLRIAQITDTHVERITHREERLLGLLDAYQPDLIVLTGDYVNAEYVNDPLAIQHTRQLFSQLRAPYGVYAVTGNVDTWNQGLTQAIFDGLENITLLEDELHVLELPGGDLYILGIATLFDERDKAMLDQLMRGIPPEAYTLLLYHKPILFAEAAAQGVDLFLAGHTHGGQVRLPLAGSLGGADYRGQWNSMGLFTQGGTRMYVSRGVGMEGLDMPRVRFLCPPEIAGIEIGPLPGAGE